MAPAPGTHEGPPGTGRPLALTVPALLRGMMKLYVYADESGTFDQAHNDLFVYGGLIAPGREAKEGLERRYRALEDSIRATSPTLGEGDEAKASSLAMPERKRLYRLVEGSPCRQFGVVVDQRRLRPSVFADKRSRQRYLDWALKMAVKWAVLSLVADGTVEKSAVSKIDVFVDEHSSSTAGKYNLSASINEELRYGMYDSRGFFHEPLFSPSLPEVRVRYLDSSSVTLIRAADVTANWIYCAERDRSACPQVMDRIESAAVIRRHP